jgi:hypothetical protein
VRLEKNFEVDRQPDFTSRIASRDETLISLFSDAKTEIVEREGNRRTTRTRYQALGKEGVATFHFHSLPDGRISFEKVCDGKIWQELSGAVSFKKRGNGTQVTLKMVGRTKALVPEFAIRVPMRDQIEQMASSLRACIEAADAADAAADASEGE